MRNEFDHTPPGDDWWNVRACELRWTMTSALYIAERRLEAVALQRVEWTALRREEGMMGLAVAGAGGPDELAREAATLHFDRHPERKRVWIVVTSGAVHGL
jgi:hypothetical protein